MPIEKMYCNESRKSLCQQHLFKVFLLWLFSEGNRFIIREVAFEVSILWCVFVISGKITLRSL